MKKLLFLLFIASFWSCTGPQEPVFLRLENAKATNISTKKITITADALFHNPNAIGGTLTATNIDVISNDVKIATVEQNIESILPAQAEFSIPLTFSTSPKELFQKDGKGILGGVINALLDKSVKLKYKGNLTFKLAGISFDSPIDLEEVVDLKK